MEKAYAHIEELADSVKEYVNTRVESAKLTLAEKSSAMIANLAAGMVVAVVFLFFLIFAGIALALVLGEWIGQNWAGFGIVAGIYGLLAIIVWFARGRLIRLPVMNAMIKQLFGNEDEED
jgi:hypothetical protein